MGSSATVGLVTVAHGDRYRAYLPEWARAVTELDRQPEAITVIVDRLDCDHVKEASDTLGDSLVVIEISSFNGRTPHVLANEAIRFTMTDWICRLDVDDLIYPHAFTPLDSWHADVCCFGLNMNGHHGLIPPRITAADVLRSPHNLLFAGSPFRRDLWQRTPGFQDIAYNDWAFWRACARVGATFLPTDTIDYFYRLDGENTSSKVDHAHEISEMLRIEGT